MYGTGHLRYGGIILDEVYNMRLAPPQMVTRSQAKAEHKGKGEGKTNQKTLNSYFKGGL